MTLKKKNSIEKILYNYSVINFNDSSFDTLYMYSNLDKKYYYNKSQAEIYKLAKAKFSKLGKRKFKNINTGEEIYVSYGDIKESIAKILRNNEQKKFLPYHIEIFSFLDKIIVIGILISFDRELKKRSQFVSWEYYASCININSKKYIVQYDVVLRNNGEKHFRIERIFDFNELIKKQEIQTEKIIVNQ